MDEKERSELDEVREGASDDAARDESAPDESASEQDAGMDAAKLSDEEATLAARAFLGTAEPEEEVSVDEAKSLLRRAGAVAEAEPEIAPAPEPEPERPSAAAPTAEPAVDTGRRWYVTTRTRAMRTR